MEITAETTVADIATQMPATIAVFQQHQIDFCCGGRIPLREACSERGLATEALIADLIAAERPASPEPDWQRVPLAALVRHIQTRYHEPLRAELPRLAAMLAKVVQRHGEHLPETLVPLQRTFSDFSEELLSHMAKEDQVVFPLIEALDAGERAAERARAIAGPIAIMEDDHERAGSALAAMRALTSGYAPPEWACPTFRGLYYGLAELEAEMHMHVHLENHVLFPRAAALAGEQLRA